MNACETSLAHFDGAGMSESEILVVDDEAGIRLILGKSLRRYGLATRTVAGGAEAVEVFRERPSAFPVVLLDIRMPDMDGPTTLAALRGIDPGVRCVFITGGA